MNALSIKSLRTTANGRFIPNVPCIEVVFVSQAPIEFEVKNNMNSVSMDTNMESQPLEAAGQTSRVGSQEPELPTLTRPTPPEMGRVTFAHLRQESNLSDASMRALKQRTRAESVDLKMVAFALKMPTAKRVQLSADFTDWNTSPIDMIRFADGVWSTTVPLPAGIYAYHFLVDGKWHGDPQASWGESRAKGVPIAFIKVK